MIGINGNILEVSSDENMSHDIFREDTLVYNSTGVIDMFEYKNLILRELDQEGLEPTKKF